MSFDDLKELLLEINKVDDEDLYYVFGDELYDKFKAALDETHNKNS